ncbi:hypothetical protein OG607_44065 [Streptomyces sp. NBC_01537]|uniref:hypothetical protein n=1 Tax=Streptomyces sp. NBC_01537 TaxID=2903896 RepID=UPI003868DE08
MRWIVIVRAGALVVGVAAMVCGVLWSVEPYRDTMAFRHAYLCAGGAPTPASAAHGCVAREIGSVTGRHTYVETISDESGSTRKTHYVVTYRRASGTQESKEVVSAVYKAAGSGERADLETWRGAVVWITVAGRSDGFDPPAEGTLTEYVMLAWAGLGLLVWFLLGDGTLRHLFGICGMRAVGWISFGFWTVTTVHFVLTYELTAWDYVLAPLFWLLGLVIAACGVFGDFGDHHGESSLVSVAFERRQRRKFGY